MIPITLAVQCLGLVRDRRTGGARFCKRWLVREADGDLCWQHTSQEVEVTPAS